MVHNFSISISCIVNSLFFNLSVRKIKVYTFLCEKLKIVFLKVVFLKIVNN